MTQIYQDERRFFLFFLPRIVCKSGDLLLAST